MATENIGGVSVLIGGDYGPLIASFSQANALAQQAGNQVAGSFTKGAAAAPQLVDQFGRAIQAAAAQVTAAAPKVDTLSVANERLASALISLSGAQDAAAGTAQKMAAAHGQNVSQIQALSGAIRVTEGTGGIRAAERFLASIPGLGSAAQLAFPAIGAIALFDAFDRLASKSIDLEGKLSALKEAAKATDSEFANLTRTIDHINVDRITQAFGRASALKLKGNLGAEDAQADFDKAKAIYRQLENLKESHRIDNQVNPATGLGIFPDIPKYGSDIRRAQKADEDKLQEEAQAAEAAGLAKSAQVAKDREDMARVAVEDAGTLNAKRIENEIQANTRLAELARQRADIWINAERAGKLAVINEQLDSHSRAVAAAALDVGLAEERAAKLGEIDYAEMQRHIALIQQRTAAEVAGKTPIEAAQIRTGATGEIAGLRSEQERKELTLHEGVLAASAKLDEAQVAQQRNITEEIIADGERRMAFVNREVEDIIAKDKRFLEAMARVTEIGERAAGVQQAAGFDSQKLELERAYGLQITHTAQQQIAFMVQLDALEERARDAKAQALELASKTALEAGELVRWAQLATEASALEAANANKTYEAKTKELEAAQRLTLQYQIQQSVIGAAKSVPGALGGALAKGIIDGKAIGRDIRESLKGIGQQLLGNVLQTSIAHLAATILANTGIQSALTGLLGAHTAATVASTAATAANATVTGTNAAATGIHAAVTGVNTVATGVNTVATVANTITTGLSAASGGIIGGVISAAGSVVGGVISAIGEQHAANKIVRAIEATTAAVNSLRLSPAASGPSGSARSSSSSAPASSSGAGVVDKVLSDLGTHIFGSSNSTQGVAVRIVGIGSASAGGGAGVLEGLFGFGGGSALPVTIVGGPALGQGGFGAFLGIIARSFLGFADGGSPPLGIPSIVGENGPELFIPREHGVVFPNHLLKGQANSPALSLPNTGSSYSSSSVANGGDTFHFTLHGVNNGNQVVDHVMRKLPDRLKARSPQFSPYSK